MTFKSEEIFAWAAYGKMVCSSFFRKNLLTRWSVCGIISKIDQMVNNIRGDDVKREEKNQQTRRRIMDSAIAEFSEKGYGASSINAICGFQGLSKGIVYHYFDTKDDLFLACVEECFSLLTETIREKIQGSEGGIESQLETYFRARMDFFARFPKYQRIFCDAVITPPEHLRTEIEKRKGEFDELNIQILEQLLEPVVLRSCISKTDVIETFRQFQDFINIGYQNRGFSSREFELREERCKKAIDILLYGIVERKERD